MAPNCLVPNPHFGKVPIPHFCNSDQATPPGYHPALQTDRFVEILLGKTASRIDMVEHKMKLYDFDSKHAFKDKIFEFRQFLVDLDDIFSSKKDSDLRTIRDDMLESVNQFLYLFTLHG